MSTRANIVVIKQDGDRHQFYHHTDGYPNWMGKTLNSFLTSSYAIAGDDSDMETIFFKLLEMEGHFEEEKLGRIHRDIEYLWVVNLGYELDTISYEALSAMGEPVTDVFKDDQAPTVYVSY